jgi:hypothetical protein
MGVKIQYINIPKPVRQRYEHRQIEPVTDILIDNPFSSLDMLPSSTEFFLLEGGVARKPLSFVGCSFPPEFSNAKIRIKFAEPTSFLAIFLR